MTDLRQILVVLLATHQDKVKVQATVVMYQKVNSLKYCCYFSAVCLYHPSDLASDLTGPKALVAKSSQLNIC